MTYNFAITILFVLSLVGIYKLLVDRASFKAILKSHGGDLDAFMVNGNFGAVLESKMAYVCDTMCLVDHFWVDSPLLKKLPKPQAEFIAAFSKYHHRYVYWLFTSNNTFSPQGEAKINFANLAQLADRAYKSYTAVDIDIPVNGAKLNNGDVREMAKLVANLLRRFNESLEVVETLSPQAPSDVPARASSNVHSMNHRVRPQVHQESPVAPRPAAKAIRLGTVRVVDQEEYDRRMQVNVQPQPITQAAKPQSVIAAPIQTQYMSDENLVPVERDDDISAAYAFFAANSQP